MCKKTILLLALAACLLLTSEALAGKPPPGKATDPDPADGAINVSTTATLSWTAGSRTDSHDVYFGTTSPGDFQGNQTEIIYNPGTMDPNTTYYWRIDEVGGGGTTTGDVWSFTTEAAAEPPGQATNPSPGDGATDVSTTATLSWTAGAGAESHDVYFGTTSPGDPKGNQAETTYNPGTMDPNTTHYWRIDEVNAGGTTEGVVWSFTTGTGEPGGPDYYVATDGLDTNPGTLAQPFATIQKAADTVSAGGTVYIRGGSYHEEVNLAGVNGSAGNRITFTNYNNETVTLDGTIPITSSWTQHSGNIYKTTLSEDIWQLFVDGKMMTLARFPNALAWTDLFWDRDLGSRWEAAGATNGHMIDDEVNGGPDTLAEQGVSFNGCVAVMNLRNWTTYARIVQNHTAGTDNFDYDSVTNYTDTCGRYFIEGFAALDQAEEWFYDQATKTLYLWADDGQNPNGRNIRGKNQSYFFSGGGNASYITIDGLNFYATTFDISGCSYITVQNCDLPYPSYSKRTLGSIVTAYPPKMSSSDHCTIYNCIFKYVDSCGVYYKFSDYPTIENNYFHHVDYACLDAGFTFNGNNTTYPVYRGNTVEISGDSEGCRLGVLNAGGDNHAVVEWNYHTRMGLMQTDGSSVQYGPDSVDDSINRFNWFIYNNRYSFRFDGNPAGNYGNVHRNVAIGGGNTGFRLKGDYHEIYNNIALDCGGGHGDFNVAIEKGGNANTVTRNIAAGVITDWPLPGTSSNIWHALVEPTTMRDQLRDPDNLDFRPKADSNLVDAGAVIEGITDGYIGEAPDIGAYEYGDSNYWIPGRIWPKASRPIPPDGSTTVKTDADIMWLTGMDAVTHDVYFGTDPTPDETEFQDNQSNNIFAPGTMDPNTTYYWRIDTVTESETITGDVWSFTVSTSLGPDTFYATDDAAIRDGLEDNYGSLNRMPIKQGTAYCGYIKFTVSGVEGTITGAKLRLKTRTVTGTDTTVYEVADNSWEEMTINGTNEPAMGTALDTLYDLDAYTWYEFDVSAFVTANGTYSLGIQTTQTAWLDWQTKEGSNSHPEIVVTCE